MMEAAVGKSLISSLQTQKEEVKHEEEENVSCSQCTHLRVSLPLFWSLTTWTHLRPMLWWSLAAESLPPQPSTSWQRVPLNSLPRNRISWSFTKFYFLAKSSRAKKRLQYRMKFSGKPTNSAVSSCRHAMHFLMLFMFFHFLPVHTKLLFRATGTLALQPFDAYLKVEDLICF